MLSTAVLSTAALAAETAGGGITPAGLGVLTFGGLVALLLITLAFRNVSNRH